MLCAPSLGGESFGMVLTEAFAQGTPVVASDIAGYRDVVRDGVDGVLVPRGDATALAETLRDLALAPDAPRARWRRAAAEHAPALRLAARRRARSLGVYEQAIDARAAHAPVTRRERVAARARADAAPTGGRGSRRCGCRASSPRPPRAARARAFACARRAGLGVAALARHRC